jgi:hypothetical protein
VLGKDLRRLGVLVDNAPPDAANPIAYLLGRDDPQLAALELLDEHRRPGGVAARLELARYRDHVAVADPADLDDLHAVSIYGDIPGRPMSTCSKLAPDRHRQIRPPGDPVHALQFAPSGSDSLQPTTTTDLA